MNSRVQILSGCVPSFSLGSVPERRIAPSYGNSNIWKNHPNFSKVAAPSVSIFNTQLSHILNVRGKRGERRSFAHQCLD